jgi:hypothetical protein
VEHLHGISLERQRRLAFIIEQVDLLGYDPVRADLRGQFWRMVQLRAELERRCKENSGHAGMYFICGVREPVGWALSLVFQRHGAGELSDDMLAPDELRISIMKWMSNAPSGAHDETPQVWFDQETSKWTMRGGPGPRFDTPEAWLDREIHGCLGLNLSEAGFDIARGFRAYDGPKGRLLVIRQESLDRLPEALAELLTAPRNLFVVPRANVSEEKTHGVLYRDLRASLRFPAAFLEELYSRPYATTFYSPEERKAFVRKWSE